MNLTGTSITQTQAITTGNLNITATGTVTLTNASNDVTYFGVSAPGQTVSFTNGNTVANNFALRSVTAETFILTAGHDIQQVEPIFVTNLAITAGADVLLLNNGMVNEITNFAVNTPGRVELSNRSAMTMTTLNGVTNNLGRLKLHAYNGLTIGSNVTITDGITEIRPDIDGNGVGDFTILEGATLFNNGPLVIYAQDITLDGSITNTGEYTTEIYAGHNNNGIADGTRNFILGANATISTNNNRLNIFANTIILNGSIENVGFLQMDANTGMTINQNLTSTGSYLWLNADKNSDGIGDFIMGTTATLSSNNNDLYITANDVVLNGTINSGTARTLLWVSDGGTIGVGTGTGDFQVSNEEINGISAGLIEIGHSNAGAITVDDLIILDSKNLTLISGSTINDDDDDGDAIKMAGTLRLDAGGDIGSLGGAEGLNIDMSGNVSYSLPNTANFTVTNRNSTGGNSNFGFALTTGNISYTLTNGDLLLNSVSTEGDVTLSATNGSILDNNGNDTGDNVTARSATLSALVEIGTLANPLEISVDTLYANTTASFSGSDFFLVEEDSINLNNVTTVNGDINIQTGGSIVEGTISVGTCGNSITLNDVTEVYECVEGPIDEGPIDEEPISSDVNLEDMIEATQSTYTFYCSTGQKENQGSCLEQSINIDAE